MSLLRLRMTRAFDSLVPVTAAFASFVLVICFFSPRFVIWLEVEAPGRRAETSRAYQTLRQLDDPSVRITDQVNRVINWRLLFPVLGHYLRVPPTAFLTLPHLGCLLVLGYTAYLVVRETRDQGAAFLSSALVGTASWFFVSTAWLAYFDSWYLLGLLLVAFSRSKVATVLACLLTPWIDERFVLSLPLALVVRVISLGWTCRKHHPRSLAEPLGMLALVAPYLALRLVVLAMAHDEGSADHVRIQLAFGHITWKLLDGLWEGLRALWVLVVAAAGMTLLEGHLVWGWLLVLLSVVTTAVNLFFAGDLSRSMSVLVPVALLGMILLVQSRSTRAKPILAAVLVFNLLTPARHVIAGTSIPETIPPLHVELKKFLHPTPDQANIYDERGRALLRRGKLTSALRSFDVAVRLDPSAAVLHWDRGDCLAALDRPEEAAACFDVAVRLDPIRPEAYLHRARFRRSRGNLPTAALDLGRALGLMTPNDPLRPDLEREVAELCRLLAEPQQTGRLRPIKGEGSLRTRETEKE